MCWLSLLLVLFIVIAGKLTGRLLGIRLGHWRGAETLANQLRGGRLTVRTEHFAGADHDAVDFWVDRLVIALVAGFSLVGSALLLLAAGMISDREVRSVLWIVGFSGLAFSTTLAMRAAAQALRRHLERVS